MLLCATGKGTHAAIHLPTSRNRPSKEQIAHPLGHVRRESISHTQRSSENQLLSLICNVSLFVKVAPFRSSWNYIIQWIGLRENLEEALDFPWKIVFSCKFSPQSIESCCILQFCANGPLEALSASPRRTVELPTWGIPKMANFIGKTMINHWMFGGSRVASFQTNRSFELNLMGRVSWRPLPLFSYCICGRSRCHRTRMIRKSADVYKVRAPVEYECLTFWALLGPWLKHGWRSWWMYMNVHWQCKFADKLDSWNHQTFLFVRIQKTRHQAFVVRVLPCHGPLWFLEDVCAAEQGGCDSSSKDVSSMVQLNIGQSSSINTVAQRNGFSLAAVSRSISRSARSWNRGIVV